MVSESLGYPRTDFESKTMDLSFMLLFSLAIDRLLLYLEIEGVISSMFIECPPSVLVLPRFPGLPFIFAWKFEYRVSLLEVSRGVLYSS